VTCATPVEGSNVEISMLDATNTEIVLNLSKVRVYEDTSPEKSLHLQNPTSNFLEKIGYPPNNAIDNDLDSYFHLDQGDGVKDLKF
jgi:hypothetical protein